MKIKINLILVLVMVSLYIKASNLPLYKDTTRIVSVNFNTVSGNKPSMFNQCIGAGRASEGLRADWQQQLTQIQKDINFKYIRFHGLFSDEMHVYTEDAAGTPIYNWQYVDKLYDFLLSVHIKPFVEFGFMPPALASEDKTVFWWKGNISPPKSYDKWAALITAAVKHFEDRYGRNEVNQWYFEVWNEPNLKEFFSGDRETYFKLYEVTAKAVKSVSTSYRVGGPATSSSTWMKESLAYFSTIPQLVDFISTHAYGTKTVFDELGKRKAQMREADGIPIPMRKLYNDVNNSAMKGREIHITEWNSSSSPKDPIHDTYQNATYALNVLKKCDTLVNSMAYWTFTDIFEEAGPPVTPFHGGFGLLNLQSIKKPTYYAFKYLNQLGSKQLLVSDKDAYATKDAQGNLQLLVWDYHLLSPDSSYNQQFYNGIIPAKNAGSIALKLSGLPNGRYQIMIYKTGYLHNDPYTAYIKMNKPFNISRQQENELKALSADKPETQLVTITNGKLNKELSMLQNDIYLIKLIKL